MKTPRREKNYNENKMKKLMMNNRRVAGILANGFTNEEAAEGAEFNPEVLPVGPPAGGRPGREPDVEGINPDPGAGDPEPSN